MKISDIFLNSSLIERSALASIGRRFTSDCNAIGGATLEEEVMKNFNNSNEDYRLLNLPTINLAINSGKFNFDFGAFASTIEELEKKSKLDEGYLSAADFFLFEVSGDDLSLIDAASLKSSIPSDPTKKTQSPCFMHNDASGQIFDWISTSQRGKNIGNVIMMLLRDRKMQVYHFDGNLDKIIDNHSILSTNKHGDLNLQISSSRIPERLMENKCMLVTNRNAKTGNKPTSFRRGIKITSSKNKSVDYFDFFEAYDSLGVMSRLCNFEVDMEDVKKSSLSAFGL